MPLTFLCLAALAIDGDTLRCANVADAQGRVRIARIDAPERDEPGGAEASAALAGLIAERTVNCEGIDADPRTVRYEARDPLGRIVARSDAGGRDLGAAMLAAGYAVSWPR